MSLLICQNRTASNPTTNPEEKEKWLNKVEDMRTRYSKILEHLNTIDELNNQIIELKKDMISILDPEEDNCIISAIENGKTTEEIEKLLQ